MTSSVPRRQLPSTYRAGKVRELHNVIERAVILTADAVLRLPPVKWQRSQPVTGAPTQAQTLADVEREHIPFYCAL